MSHSIPSMDPDAVSNHKTVVRITKQVDVEGEQVHVVDEEAIEKIFGRSDVKHCPVAIYSIAGGLRGGKSFFLNLVSRYLDFRVDNEESDWRKDIEAVLNKSFEWRGGTERHTEGILVWSEPYWLSNDKYKKIAVFLMDTQGVFDDQSTKFSDSVLFCLSAFLSSYQIYNLSGTLNSADLDCLKVFSDYGTQVYGQKLCETYQTLLFLMRDWGNIDFGLGFEGGNEYLKTKMDEKDCQSTEYKTLCRNIKTSFKDVKCTLLPHPGKKITQRRAKDPSASIKDIDPDFLETTEEIIEEMFRSVQVKEIDGLPVRGEEIMNLAIKISNQVEENKFGADALMLAFSSTSLGYLVERCENMFYTEVEAKISPKEHKFISSNDTLSNAHKEIVAKVMNYFDREQKYGLNPMVSSCRADLEGSLYRKKTLMKSLNEISEASIVELYRLLAEDCFEACLKKFEENYRVDLKKEFSIPAEVLVEKFSDVMNEAFALFEKVTEGYEINKEIRENSLDYLKAKLNVLMHCFSTKNKLQQAILFVDALKLTCKHGRRFVEKLFQIKEQDECLMQSAVSNIKKEVIKCFLLNLPNFGSNTWWTERLTTRLESTMTEYANVYCTSSITFLGKIEIHAKLKEEMKRLEAMLNISVKELIELKTSIIKLVGKRETLPLILPVSIVESWIKTQELYDEMNKEYLQTKVRHQQKLVVKQYNEKIHSMLVGRSLSNLQMEMFFKESENIFQSMATTWPSEIAKVESNAFKHEIEASLWMWKVVNNFHKYIYVRKLRDFHIYLKAMIKWFKSWFVETNVEKMRLAFKPKEWRLDVKMGNYKPKFANLRSVA